MCPCIHHWAWCQGCSGDERQLADKISATVSPGREPVKVTEGDEPPEFWDSLGGKTDYASGKWLEEVTPSHPPRLFQCSNASGFFAVEEIFDFAQQVLSSLTVANSTTLVDLHVTSPSPSPHPPFHTPLRTSLRRMWWSWTHSTKCLYGSVVVLMRWRRKNHWKLPGTTSRVILQEGTLTPPSWSRSIHMCAWN